jgi:hypothetical protein
MLRKLIFTHRLKKAIKKAKQASELTGKKYLVITWKKRPVCISKQQLKLWIRTKKFAKGITIQDIEQRAIFTT